MKFTYNWLCDHIDTDLNPLQIKNALIELGLEVEDYINYKEKFKGFTVAFITDAVKHPNADSLRICQVDIGKETREIVCGAPNARKGIKVVFADEGMYIPGTDITLKKASIRGVESSGMMLSERELTLSDDHDSIIELPENAKVGDSILPYMGLDDVLYDVSITLNRAYALGVRGIARDLVAFGKGTLKPLQGNSVARTLQDTVEIDLDNDICSYFKALVVKNINNSATLPIIIENRLKLIGIKLNSTVVDLANYLTIDLNQPFHIYDYDKISNKISVRFAKEGESIKCLDDKEHKLKLSYPLICNENKPICIAGIMGGVDSSCTKETKNILIECAYFNNNVVLKSSSSLAISSESSYRYSRFINKHDMEENLNTLLALVKDNTGGDFGNTCNFGSLEDTREEIELDLEYFNKLSGVLLGKEELVAILTNLEFEIIKVENSIIVKPPYYRFDVATPSCLVEEIVRVYELYNIKPAILPNMYPVLAFKNHKESDLSQDLAYIFANKGLQEVVNMSFICPNLANTLGIYDEKLKLENPISSKLSLMRKSIMPSLLNVYLSNYSKGKRGAKIFEAGDIYNFDLQNKQELQLACLISGNNKEPDAFEKPRPVDVYDAKAILFEALEDLGVSSSKLTYITDNLPSYYHSSRASYLGFGYKNVVACFGQLHPRVKKQLGIKEDIMLFEIFTERLAKFVKQAKVTSFVPSNLMSLTRDFAFIVENNIDALQFIKVAKSSNKLITNVNIFDIYNGENVEEGKKSVAFSVTIQPKDQTLKGEEIEKICNDIIANIEKTLNGVLRV